MNTNIESKPVAHWPFEEIKDGRVLDKVGEHHGLAQGTLGVEMFVEDDVDAPVFADGVIGRSLKLNYKGYSAHQDRVLLPDARGLVSPERISLSAWVNPYTLNRGEQVVLWGGHVSERTSSWELYLNKDNQVGFRVYLNSSEVVSDYIVDSAGHWFHVAVVIQDNQVELFVNGQPSAAGELPFSEAVRSTEEMAMGCAVRREEYGIATDRPFSGALDEVKVFHNVLKPGEIQTLANFSPSPHSAGLDISGGYPLWQGDPVPKMKDIPVLDDVRFSVVKSYQPQDDGYRYQHTPTIEWHKGKLYAAWTANSQHENASGQLVVYRVSKDNGATWSELSALASGSEKHDFGFSEPMLFSHDGQLWAFIGVVGNPAADAYFGKGVGTKVLRLDNETNDWVYIGEATDSRFWPMQRPQQMDDGNWIMSGVDFTRNLSKTTYHLPAAVLISNGTDFSRWDKVVLPPPPGPQLGESTVLVSGNKVTNIARYHPEMRTIALASVSEDYGRTWTPQEESNLPLASTKVNSGTLSTGHSYLVANNAADSGNWRSPLTIALTRPGEDQFSHIWVIRHSECPDSPGESHPRGRMHYPCAVEYDGDLYVIYSVDGQIGRIGEGRQIWNNNSIELAVIPLDSLLKNAW